MEGGGLFGGGGWFLPSAFFEERGRLFLGKKGRRPLGSCTQDLPPHATWPPLFPPKLLSPFLFFSHNPGQVFEGNYRCTPPMLLLIPFSSPPPLYLSASGANTFLHHLVITLLSNGSNVPSLKCCAPWKEYSMFSSGNFPYFPFPPPFPAKRCEFQYQPLKKDGRFQRCLCIPFPPLLGLHEMPLLSGVWN